MGRRFPSARTVGRRETKTSSVGPGGGFGVEGQAQGKGVDSEVSLFLRLCGKVLLVLGAASLSHLAHLAHLCVFWHVCQRVGADDVPAEARTT